MELQKIYEYTHQGTSHSMLTDPIGDFHYLMVESDKLSMVVNLALDRAEMMNYVHLLDTTLEILPSLTPGQIEMVGSLSPRPVVLGLNAVRPAEGPPFVLARLSQRTDAIADFVLGRAEDIAAFAGRCRVDLAGGNLHPPEDGVLMAWGNGEATLETAAGATKIFMVVEGFSQLLGSFGEFRHSKEIFLGEKVRIWSTPGEKARLEKLQRLPIYNEEVVATTPESPPTPAFCRRGEELDRRILAGQYFEAYRGAQALCKEILETKKVHGFLLVKLALTMLLAETLRGNTRSAGAIWTCQADPLTNAGIKLLENGQASDSDLLLYRELEGYLHSVGGDPQRALSGVNQTMPVLLQSCAKGDPVYDRQGYLLSNWMIHLMEVFEGPPPAEALADWNSWQARYGRPVEAKALFFRAPSPWVISWDTFSLTQASAPVKRPWWKKLLGAS